jgi:hypothetical protein
VFTLFAAGCVSALLFAMGVYTPSKPELYDLGASRSAMMTDTNSTLQQLSGVATATSNASLAAQVAAQNASFVKMANSTRWVENSAVINTWQNASTLQASFVGI